MSNSLDRMIIKKAKEYVDQEVKNLCLLEQIERKEALKQMEKYYDEKGLGDFLYSFSVEISEVCFHEWIDIETDIHQPLQKKVFQLVKSELRSMR